MLLQWLVEVLAVKDRCIEASQQLRGDDRKFPTAFVFHAAAVILDGTVVDAFTWDQSQGVALNHDLVTCSFIIPIGDLAGAEATFTGYFLP